MIKVYLTRQIPIIKKNDKMQICGCILCHRPIGAGLSSSHGSHEYGMMAGVGLSCGGAASSRASRSLMWCLVPHNI